MTWYIIYNKKTDRFMMWSTVIAAPISWPLTEEELRKEYPKEVTDQRISRARETGTSSHQFHSMEDTVHLNRAGLNGNTLTSAAVWRMMEKDRNQYEDKNE